MTAEQLGQPWPSKAPLCHPTQHLQAPCNSMWNKPGLCADPWRRLGEENLDGNTLPPGHFVQVRERNAGGRALVVWGTLEILVLSDHLLQC